MKFFLSALEVSESKKVIFSSGGKLAIWASNISMSETLLQTLIKYINNSEESADSSALERINEFLFLVDLAICKCKYPNNLVLALGLKLRILSIKELFALIFAQCRIIAFPVSNSLNLKLLEIINNSSKKFSGKFFE